MRNASRRCVGERGEPVPLRRRFTTMASASDGGRDCAAQRGPTPREQLLARQSQGQHLRDQPANYLRCGSTDERRWIASRRMIAHGFGHGSVDLLVRQTRFRCTPLDSSRYSRKMRRLVSMVPCGNRPTGLVKSRALWQESALARDACDASSDASSGELRPTAEP